MKSENKQTNKKKNNSSNNNGFITWKDMTMQRYNGILVFFTMSTLY